MFARKTSIRSRRRHTSRFLPASPACAVRFVAEPLEGRVVLSFPAFPVVDMEPPSESDLPAASDLTAKISAHTLTAAEMDANNIAEVEWNGRRVYARRNEWLLRLALASPASANAATELSAMGFEGVSARNLGRYESASVVLGGDFTAAELAAALTRRNMLRYIEPNLILISQATPNDTDYATKQWAMNNTGQDGGSTDADIDAPEAWDVETGATGSNAIVVAVLDTGIDRTHDDLTANLWTNTAEISGDVAPNPSGDDDDGNGFVDDYHGWDAISNDGDPADNHGHGTKVAGVIGAVGDNGIGITGVAWTTTIVAVKVVNSSGQFEGDWTTVRDGLDYIAALHDDDVKVRVANASMTYAGDSETLQEGIDELEERDILFVAAAGNDGYDNDTTLAFPGNSTQANVLSVAGTTASDTYSFTNVGATTVHLNAPGVGVLTTVMGDTYSAETGSSMAAPHVAGVAALAWSLDSDATMREVRAAILQGSEPLADLHGWTVTGGRLNAHKTLDMIDGLPETVQGTGSGESIQIRPYVSNPSLLEVLVGTSHPAPDGASISSIKWLHIEGLGGGDTITVDPAITFPVWVEGGDGNDSITGGAGRDLIDGGAGTDTLIGGAGSDIMSGGDAADTLRGGAGNDSTNGGPGNDTYSFVGDTLGIDSIGEKPNLDTDLIDLTGFTHNSTTVAVNLYRVRAAGDGAINHANLQLYLSQESAIENVKGSAGIDTFYGNSRNNTFWGEAGSDTYYATDPAESGTLPDAGGDTFNGGSGTADTADYSKRSTALTISLNGNADDGVTDTNSNPADGNQSEADNIKTDVEVVVAGTDDDALTAGNAAHLIGGQGNDTLIGNNGNDTLDGGGAADTLIGNAGNDTLNGEGGTDLIFGDSDDPNYTGLGGNDNINGGDDNDVCYGGNDGDSYGGSADILTGGPGSDNLWGGHGHDTFLANLDDTVDYLWGGSGNDTAAAAQRDTGNPADVLNSIENP